MPQIARVWTRAEVLALPADGNRYEVLDGELLVSPSPRPLHQRAVWRLYDLVAPYVKALRFGETGMAPADLAPEPGQLLQPDLFVVKAHPPRLPADWADWPLPILVVEVLSPSTARYDRTLKRRFYQRAGVGEYWIIDPDARLIERWQPRDSRPEILSERLKWQPDPAITPLEIDLEEYFAELWGEGLTDSA